MPSDERTLISDPIVTERSLTQLIKTPQGRVRLAASIQETVNRRLFHHRVKYNLPQALTESEAKLSSYMVLTKYELNHCERIPVSYVAGRHCGAVLGAITRVMDYLILEEIRLQRGIFLFPLESSFESSDSPGERQIGFVLKTKYAITNVAEQIMAESSPFAPE